MCARFCSSVPNSRSTAAHGDIVGAWSFVGYSYPASSSLNARWCAGDNPWPPYSFGKQMPAKPASNTTAATAARG